VRQGASLIVAALRQAWLRRDRQLPTGRRAGVVAGMPSSPAEPTLVEIAFDAARRTHHHAPGV